MMHSVDLPRFMRKRNELFILRREQLKKRETVKRVVFLVLFSVIATFLILV